MPICLNKNYLDLFPPTPVSFNIPCPYTHLLPPNTPVSPNLPPTHPHPCVSQVEAAELPTYTSCRLGRLAQRLFFPLPPEVARLFDYLSPAPAGVRQVLSYVPPRLEVFYRWYLYLWHVLLWGPLVCGTRTALLLTHLGPQPHPTRHMFYPPSTSLHPDPYINRHVKQGSETSPGCPLLEMLLPHLTEVFDDVQMTHTADTAGEGRGAGRGLRVQGLVTLLTADADAEPYVTAPGAPAEGGPGHASAWARRAVVVSWAGASRALPGNRSAGRIQAH